MGCFAEVSLRLAAAPSEGPSGQMRSHGPVARERYGRSRSIMR